MSRDAHHAPFSQVAVINDQHRAGGVVQHGNARRIREFVHTATVACAGNHQLDRWGILAQIIQNAAVDWDLRAQVGIASPPLGKSAIQACPYPLIAVALAGLLIP